MSVERYFNESSVTTTETGYGYSCKAFVDALLEADDGIFTLARIDSDTDKLYTVWLRIWDTDAYLKIYNKNLDFYANYYIGLDGVSTNNAANTNDPCVAAVGYTYRATVSRLGDFAFTVTFTSDSCTTGCQLKFAKFVSDYDDREYYIMNGSSPSGGLLAYIADDPFSSVSYSYDAVTGERIDCSIISTSTAASGIISASKTTAVLMPYQYCVFVPNKKWLGHIRWGGRYDLYNLVTNGTLNVMPNADYIVDGVTYKGLFTSLIIPVECT